MIITEHEARVISKLSAGSCYLGAYLMLERCPYREHGLRLCHGVCVLTVPPYEEFGHGWIEETLWNGSIVVWDRKWPTKPIERARYYMIGQVREHTVQRYSWFAAKRLMKKFQMYGPWDATVAAAAHNEVQS